MKNEYSKREIDLILNGFKEHTDSYHSMLNEKLDKILDQTTKTNGRVNRLEGWRSLLAGAWIVVSTFVIPLLIYVGLIEKKHIEETITHQQEAINHLLAK